MKFFNSQSVLFCTILYLLLVLSSNIKANVNSSYWQQQVNYEIEVTLNDKTHELDGFITITYTNNSPNSINKIPFLLYPNAYASDNTAFAKQQLENNDVDFYFSNEAMRGGINNFSFTVNGKAATFALDDEHIDIGYLTLNNSLNNGETIKIQTPFKVKIPNNFSRLGRDRESYQITQWFPKPAVYDNDGWHAYPYLTQGEFYYEYGNFDVKITLPKNYVVAATGDLQTASEIDFLNQKVKETQKITNFDERAIGFNSNLFPASSNEMKTVHFIQNDVHDFAWFADKRFHVLNGEVHLNDGRTVNTYAYFLDKEINLWKDAVKYINQSVEFYSEKVGNYPYNVCSAVQGALIAGGGMEYPTITIIGGIGSAQTLDRIIAHEVGHNWFQGIIGSNERVHPWMDEGINSYYETRYMNFHWPDLGLLESRTTVDRAKLLGLDGFKSSYQNELGYLVKCRMHTDQACSLHSAEYTNANYGLIVYAKAALAFKYLESYLGTKVFDKIMQQYFANYTYKHPQPEDLKALFDANTKKDLNWFWQDVLGSSKQLDYAIKSINDNKVIVKNKGDIVAPLAINAVKNGEVINTVWYNGFENTRELIFDYSQADQVAIDYEMQSTDVNRKNNLYKLNGLAKKIEPLRLQPVVGLENPNKTQLYYTLMSSVNHWDGYAIGLGLYNGIIPSKNFEWFAAPMYAFKSKSLVGFGKANAYFHLKNSFIKNIRLGLGLRSFHDTNFEVYGPNNDNSGRALISSDYQRYFRIVPELEIKFKKITARSNKNSNILFRHINLTRDDNTCNFEGDTVCAGVLLRNSNYYINELSLNHKNERAINPYNFTLMAEQGDGFIKTSIEADYKLTYLNKNSGFTSRIYGAYFPTYTNSNLQFVTNNLGLRGVTNNYDYKYDSWLIGRNKDFSQDNFSLSDYQTAKIPSGFHSNSYIGVNNKWMAALNLAADIPKVPVEAYFNFATFYVDPNIQTATSAFELGATIKPIPNVFEIYIPFAFSENLERNLNQEGLDKFFERITFMLDINRLDIFKNLRNNKLLN